MDGLHTAFLLVVVFSSCIYLLQREVSFGGGFEDLSVSNLYLMLLCSFCR